jgi:hypothetical protein
MRAKFFAEEFRASSGISTLGARFVNMAPSEAAMCYFTHLQGRFNGGGEFAEIVPIIDSNGVERWRLRTKAMGNSTVWAGSRCYLRDQR